MPFKIILNKMMFIRTGVRPMHFDSLHYMSV